MPTPATVEYLIPSALRSRLEEHAFGDLSVTPIVRIEDPTGIACWLITAIDGDRLFCLGDLGLGGPEVMIVGHAFLSAMVGPLGDRLTLGGLSNGGWTLATWARVARRTGSIAAAEIELWRAGEALALSRCTAAEASP